MLLRQHAVNAPSGRISLAPFELRHQEGTSMCFVVRCYQAVLNLTTWANAVMRDIPMVHISIRIEAVIPRPAAFGVSPPAALVRSQRPSGVPPWNT